ncbi:MAG: MotA/TolQ/ExbB proton channel family protein [Gammaproteobacteria bacterium]
MTDNKRTMALYRIICGLAAQMTIASVANATEQVTSLDQLVEKVRHESVLESKALAAREQAFKQARDQRAAQLASLKAQLAGERRRGEDLKSRYEENETFISSESERLHEKMGSLGELFGVVRQTAKDLQSLFRGSLVSAQKPNREGLLQLLSERKTNPSIQELEDFWRLMVDEMVETGKVTRFSAPVITLSGEEQQREVVRLGAFNVVSDGLYLRYLPETGRLVELGRQPALRFTEQARELQGLDNGLTSVAIDPSRGAILSLMVQSPDLFERIGQGGVIGYLIIAVGVLGLFIVVERFVVLTLVHRKMQTQRQGENLNEDTPLFRVRQVADANPELDSEALGLKLDQAILKERPFIKRFLPTLAVFAAISPLLGLLGTVSGMIETFQAITLFGTGDPKLMSGGISVALITTELGLVVAIPLVLMHNWLSGRAKGLIFILDEESAAQLAVREENRHVNA